MNQPLTSVPWGAWIGVYVILTGLASGLTLVIRLVRPADTRAATSLEWIGSWLSLGFLAVCTIILVADLERPTRFFLMLTQFTNAGSLMAWGAKIIALKMALLALQLFLLHRRRQALAADDPTLEGRPTIAVYAVVSELLGLVSFALVVYPAFLLSWTWSSPASHNAGSALVYLSSGALLGAAAVSLAATFVPHVGDSAMHEGGRRTLLRLLGAHVVALGFFMLALRANATRAVFEALWHGAWSGIRQLLFGATCLAVLLAALVQVARGRVALRVALSVAVLVSAATSRYLIFAVH